MIVLFGFIKADIKNWKLEPLISNQINKNESKILDAGGFMPFGHTGIFKSIPKCFYAFIGFDAIASTCEEAKNPHKDVPKAIIIAILVLSFIYIILSCVITLMEPYFMINEFTPFSSTFEFAYPNFKINEVNVFKVLIILNILLSIAVSIYGEMYVVSRIISTMANDGLILKKLSKLSKNFRSPIFAIFFASIISAIFAVFLEIMELIDLLAMGALSAYCVVSICLVLLRYKPGDISSSETIDLKIEEDLLTPKLNFINFIKESFNPSKNFPNLTSIKIINIVTTSSGK